MANNVAYTGNNRVTFCSPVKDPFVIVSNLLLSLLLLLSVLVLIVIIIIVSTIIIMPLFLVYCYAVEQKLMVEFYIPLVGCRMLSSSVGKEAE